jgi:hypothetical protein
MAMPITYCTVDGCSDRCKGHGLCNRHYMRNLRRGSTEDRSLQRPKRLGPCTECGAESVARNLCRKHYATTLRTQGFGNFCSVDSCERSRYSKGLCSLHYGRTRDHGVTTPNPRPSPEERFWPFVNKDGLNGCWLWIGAKDQNGYGKFWSGERLMSAHIYSYLLHGGQIEPGWHVDHLCVVPSCVNPSHLEGVPARENTRRAWVRILSDPPHCQTCS